MTEQETINYWTNKINVELPQKLEEHIDKCKNEILEHNRTSEFKIDLSIARAIPMEHLKAARIPAEDYEILRKNNIQLTGYWECCSGIEAYTRVRKMSHYSMKMSLPPAQGTPIEGYYKVVGENEKNLICYYNRQDSNAFVSQEIEIHKYQLYAPISERNKDYIEVGDIFHVDSIRLVNNRYAIQWTILPQ